MISLIIFIQFIIHWGVISVGVVIFLFENGNSEASVIYSWHIAADLFFHAQLDLCLISPKYCVYASVNRVSIGSDNGLSHNRRQAII